MFEASGVFFSGSFSSLFFDWWQSEIRDLCGFSLKRLFLVSETWILPPKNLRTSLLCSNWRQDYREKSEKSLGNESVKSDLGSYLLWKKRLVLLDWIKCELILFRALSYKRIYCLNACRQNLQCFSFVYKFYEKIKPTENKQGNWIKWREHTKNSKHFFFFFPSGAPTFFFVTTHQNLTANFWRRYNKTLLLLLLFYESITVGFIQFIRLISLFFLVR